MPGLSGQAKMEHIKQATGEGGGGGRRRRGEAWEGTGLPDKETRWLGIAPYNPTLKRMVSPPDGVTPGKSGREERRNRSGPIA